MIDVFNRIRFLPELWDGLTDPNIAQRVVALEPLALVRNIDADELDRLTGAFAAVIDALDVLDKMSGSALDGDLVATLKQTL